MQTLNCPEFAKNYQSEASHALLLDVRNPDEVATGILPGAKNIPLPQLETRLAELNKNTLIFIYCKAGGRAQKAGELLEKNGFQKVICAINGGYADLQK